MSISFSKATLDKPCYTACLQELIFEPRDCIGWLCGVFLDFAKAFDGIQLSNLVKQIGTLLYNRGSVLKLLSSYLTTRYQFLLTNDEQLFFTQRIAL